jgi:hypothetical protein
MGGIFTGTIAADAPGNVTGSCASTWESSEAIFRWVPEASGRATIKACRDDGTTFDTVLYVRSGNCLAGPEVGCNDNARACRPWQGGAANGSRLHFEVKAGETYFLVVDGAEGESGTFRLKVRPPGGPTSRTENDPDEPVPPTPAVTPTAGDATPAPTATPEEPTSYRCDAADRESPVTRTALQLSDRFGDVRAEVRSLRGDCAPVAIEDGEPAGDEPLERYRLHVRRFEAAEATHDLHVEHQLGAAVVDLLRPHVLQLPAGEDPALVERAADAKDRFLCYGVRLVAPWPLDAPEIVVRDPKSAEPTLYAVEEPIRLCTAVDAIDGTVQLCHRAHVVTDDPAASDAAVDELCLPATIVTR